MSYRAQIKQHAKDQLHPRFWWLFLGFLIPTLISLALGGGQGALNSLFNLEPRLLFSPLALLSGVLPAASILLCPFLAVGVASLALKVARGEPATIGTPFIDGSVNYGRKLGGMLLVALYTLLWSFLFLIPGIVKAYAYSFTPYLLSECPNLKATDAISLSQRMTQGAKGELFVFDLSFILWGLLCTITGGLAGCYVIPYYYTAHATLYESIKKAALESGKVSPLELA